MGGFGGSQQLRRILRRLTVLLGLVVGCLVLANCSGNVAGRLDPRWGVASSARVIPPGEPVPKGGGVYRVGKPYTVAGRTYVPEVDNHYSAVGMASWYGDDFRGRYTANGEIFDENAISAASPTLPLPSYVRVTNLENHRSIIVRVNDRGPYVGNRLIDVSVRTAKLLGFYGAGLTKVKVEYVGRAPLAGSSDRELMATLREHEPASGVKVASAETFAPAYFDPHRMNQIMPRRAPVPPDRPYDAGEGTPARQDRAAQAQTQRQAPAVEMAAASPAGEPQVTPVSAYAPMRSDGHTDLLSGRGLY
jgi:peptidoglycan lytic transglycosylase